jgi:glycosyltransferase involved in cell wall biosynthesis
MKAKHPDEKEYTRKNLFLEYSSVPPNLLKPITYNLTSITSLMTPLLSVLIPAHGRLAILKKTLEALNRQTIAENIEVIVMNDDTQNAQEIEHLAKQSWYFAHSFCTIPPCHQGVARNRGVHITRAPLVLFIGDDIFLAPDCCERHVKAHAALPHALPLTPSQGEGGNCQLPIAKSLVLGHTTWDRASHITPVMQWLEKSGWQFDYGTLDQLPEVNGKRTVPSHTQHLYTYTSHISLATELAKSFPFREDISLYGWEDIEWGMRLRSAGVPLVYFQSATALHHHHITLEDSLKRMRTLGAAAQAMKKLVPDFDRVPTGWKMLAYRFLALFPTIAGKHRREFLRGLIK